MHDVGDDLPVRIGLDADALIYAASMQHEVGARIRALFEIPERYSLSGSTLLLPEVLTKPQKTGSRDELDELKTLIAQLELRPASRAICEAAVQLGATYGLDAMDAIHLATAVDAAADAFLTNNTKDFDRDKIIEIDVLYPDDLPV